MRRCCGMGEMMGDTPREHATTATIQAHKRQLRRTVLARRRALPEIERLARSRQVWERLSRLPWYRQAGVILGYMAIDKEVLTDGLLRQALAAGKRVVLPRVRAEPGGLALYAVDDLERDVAPGYRGIPEPRPERGRPVPIDALDLVLVPGVAFDLQGGRLGFGVGFYDRLLSGLPQGTPKVGLAFDFQVLPWLPRQPHDIALDAIVTESRTIRCRPLSTCGGATPVARRTHTAGGEGEV
jgi:5-formyltetrahydrofolate cyclo-ligase